MIYGLVTVTISTGLGVRHRFASLRASIFASWPCWRCRSLPSPGHCSTCHGCHGAMKCPQVLGPFLSGKNGFSNDPTSLVCKRQIYSNYIYIYDIIWINTSWHIIRSPFSPCLQRHFSLGPDWEVAPTVVAEVWRVAFRQVVRIGESAKVGREVPWKCQRFGKTQGVQLVQPVSGDFLEIFWRFSGDF